MIPSPSAAFDTARAANFQQPIFVLQMPGLGLTYCSRQDPKIAATSTWLQIPSGLSQSLTDLQGKASIGSFAITMVDINRALLAKFANTVWYGQQANVYLGFFGTNWTGDYALLFSGIVKSVTPNSAHTGFTFNIVDRKQLIKQKIYLIGDDGVNPTSKKNPKTLDGNPLDLVTDLMTNQLKWPTQYLDQTAIAALRNGRFSATRMVFSITKAQDALTFLENELLMPNGLFHFCRYNGMLSVGDMLAAPSPVPIAFAFTDSNIVDIPAFAQKNIYNWVSFQLDYDGSNYLDTEEFVDSASVNKYGLSNVLQITSKGLRTNLQGASRAGITARRIFQRYANGPTGLITFDHPSVQAGIVEVGDYVTVTHRLLEDLDTGALGVTNRIYQVMAVQSKWAAGKMSFTLLDVNAMASRKAFQYAPPGIPAFTAASAAQQGQYIFQANAQGQQSNGVAANEIF